MNKLVLLDSNSLLNRAFYALPPLNAKDGTPTNAVLGYVNILIKIIKEIAPTHIIATFDLKAPTFRKKMYDAYKAGRKPMPEELAAQLPIIKKLLTLMNIQIVELESFEADDIIGTLARQCEDETIIVTGDKDSLQLVSDSTTVWLTKKGISEVIEYTPQRLLEDGLTPSQVIDLKSLMGDSSDNIPGVPGVGEKTAKDLLDKYKTLDGVYEHVDELKGKLQERIRDNRDLAYLSYELATINVNVPVTFDEEKSNLRYPFDGEVAAFMDELNFKSVISRLEFAGEVTPKNNFVPPNELVEIKDNATFDRLSTDICSIKRLSVYYDGGFHIAINKDVEYLIREPMTLFDELNFDHVMEDIKAILADDSIKKYIYDIKNTRYLLGGCLINNAEDIALIAYLIKAHVINKDINDLFEEHGLDATNIATNMLYLYDTMYQELDKMELVTLYNDVEMPLINVLYDMESVGIKIDRELMSKLGAQYLAEINELSEEIYAICGEKFNINSPKQLGHILFDVLELKHGKKNKTGSYSTNVDILDSLRGEHPVIEMILRYREINKLLSTYINGLEPLLDSQNRLHTVFKQMLTSTGRLSSTEPNLQNIPVRREEGRELRKMFIASEGNTLVCADYSQIELRLLAHFSEDKVLLDAFKNGEDIHTFTASKVNKVPISAVTPEMRSRSKAVNFGIIYGISDFGLAQDIGCPTWEAKEFIAKYFETYPSVKTYLDSLVEYAKEHGFARTLLGRIRFIPDIKSQNFNTRSFGERVAKNMPLQGSASDIIKLAMIKVAKALKEGGFKAQMVLQIHDELLIDCPTSEASAVSALLKREMESAASLRVKLIADVNTGGSWYEAK